MESSLSPVLQEALRYLREQRMPEARVDVVIDNWIYLWLPDVILDEAKYHAPHQRGMWVRIPIQFPFVNPHGIITKEPLNPIDGHAIKGHNPNHPMCAPVSNLGGVHYYSWTWSGELGQSPPLRISTDILAVVAWVERRIRQA